MESASSLRFEWAAATQIGGRSENQDSWQGDIGRQQAVFIVADGLGGQMDGALAAQTAVEAARMSAAELEGAGADVVAKGAVLAAAAQVAALRQARGSDMASTIVVLVLTAAAAAWSWCGDSRLYRLRSGTLDRLTNDHSVSMAQIEPQDRWTHDVRADPGRSRLISVLGQESPHIEQGSCQPSSGDLFLLCSDGFWEHLPRTEMMALCNAEAEPAKMLNSVLERQLPDQDNLTLIRVALL